MSTIHVNETTTATPEQSVAGLTGFGPGRSELFPRSADRYLTVVVDITDPIDGDAFEPLDLAAGSAAQEIAAKASAARVVKAYNTTFAATLAEGTVAGQPLDALIASDDEDAKAIVSSIVASSGLRPVDVDPLKRARELEALGYLHMAMQQPLEANCSSAVKVLS